MRNDNATWPRPAQMPGANVSECVSHGSLRPEKLSLMQVRLDKCPLAELFPSATPDEFVTEVSAYA